MSVNIADYPTLNTYAVLASSGITSATGTTVSNGFYGSSPTESYPGISGTPGTTANNGTAQTQLTALVGAINAVAPNLPLTSVATGAVTYTPGKYVSASLVTYGSGTSIILDPGSNPNAQFFFIGAPGITFNSVSSIDFKSGTSGSFSNVFWLTSNGIISFTGTSPTLISGIFIGSSKVTFASPSTIVGRVYAQTENVTFDGVGASSFVNGTMPVVCYAKGSLILTERGYIPIEHINAGDKIVVKGKVHDVEYYSEEEETLKSVAWIGNFQVNNMSNDSCPICIKANAFGENTPFEDLYVSPAHRILFNDRMVEARDLINGETIFQDLTRESIEYYHIEVEDHSVIYANGILAESYFDAENRYVFTL